MNIPGNIIMEQYIYDSSRHKEIRDWLHTSMTHDTVKVDLVVAIDSWLFKLRGEQF